MNELLGEPLSVFLRRPHRYRRLRFRARLALWRLLRNYEEPEWYLLDHLVDPRRAAIDVGGLYGGYAGRLAQLTARVHCFEPFPAAAQQLAWRLPASVIIHQAAVSRSSGTAELRVPSHDMWSNPVANATLEASNALDYVPHVRRVACQLVRLDDVIDEPVGFIKVDVEGHELAVFQGAERIIATHRPNILVESANFLNPDEPDALLRHFRDRGYEGVFLFGGGMMPLSRFDKALHQELDVAGRPVPGVVNNFILLPSS
jgi:FkbM family methyltransferase